MAPGGTIKNVAGGGDDTLKPNVFKGVKVF
jgi:hypothetical protein